MLGKVKLQKNMEKVLIDANVILRYLLRDVEEMANDAEKIIKSGACTLPEVLAEVIYVLKSVYKVDKKEICTAIFAILNEIEVEHKKNIFRAVEIFSEKNLDFVDCILIAYSEIENFKVFSFDKKLNKNLK